MCGNILRWYIFRNIDLKKGWPGVFILGAIVHISIAQKCIFQVNYQIPVVWPLYLMGKVGSKGRK